MKKYKKTLTVVIILILAILIFGAFYGVQITNEKGEKVNLIPGFKLGMEFGDTRVITATVSDETITTIYDKEGKVVTPEEGKEYKEEDGYTTVEQKTNIDAIRKVANYKKSRDIIKERLEKSNVSQFFIDLNEKNGELKIQIPEDANADEVQDIIQNSGGFMFLDGETFEVVLDSTYFKKADIMYSQGELETGVFLQIELNEEGTAKLKELNEIYVETTTTETNEAGEEEETTASKQVWVILNDALIGSTVLPNIVYDDKIMLTFGVSNNSVELQTAIDYAEKEAILLNSGTAPLVYKYSNEVEQSKITTKMMIYVFGAIGALFAIAFIYLVIKFKAKGFISVYFQIGFLGALFLIFRLTGTLITMEGMAGILMSMILNYIFTYIVLSNITKGIEGMYKKSNLKFFLNTLPVYAVAVIFTFATRAHISSFGTTLFWGIVMIYIFNFIFSKYVYENLKIGGKHENA